MTGKTKRFGFWDCLFPKQLGNLCFVIFLVCLSLFVLDAVFDRNVFDPDAFKSRDARIPELGTRRVVDESGVLTQGEIGALTSRIDAYEAASGGQMAVLLVNTLYGDALEDFSLAVAEKWKIGWKGEDNGVLLLLVMNDHRSRLEIGYGLEGVINDARAGDILRAMAPFMRNGQYAQAISFVIESVSAFVLHENAPEAPEDDPDSEDGTGFRRSMQDGPQKTLAIVIALSILFMTIGTIAAYIMIHPDAAPSFGMIAMLYIGKILLEILKAMLRSGSRSGGGGRSGGRSGGGGGGFGGGGASGRW